MARKIYNLKSIYLGSILIAIVVVGLFLLNSNLFLFQKTLHGSTVEFEEIMKDDKSTEENETTIFDGGKMLGSGNNLKLVDKLKALL